MNRKTRKSTDILLIFIKNPQLGRVKTRLARTLGDPEALRIYRILMEYTRKSALGIDVKRWLYYSDFVQKRDGWSSREFSKKIQHGNDLGGRMENAFREAFDAGTQRAIIIGSDCPELNPAILATAFEQLDTSDFVIGPTPDGGYYLLGMREFCPQVFHDVAWSTAEVFPKTLEIINKMGKKVALLPKISDIDEEKDWLEFCGKESK